MRLFARLALIFALLSASAWAEPNSGKLVVQILSIHSDKGSAGCALYASADGYATNPKKALAARFVPIHGGKAVCEFAGLKPGVYAVSIIHDENSNGKLDTNFIGMPKEGVGASNDAKGFMGPPKFKDAKFTYPGGQMTIVIHMKYLL